MVFRSDTDVCDVGDDGGAPPLFGQRHHFAEEDSIPQEGKAKEIKGDNLKSPVECSY